MNTNAFRLLVLGTATLAVLSSCDPCKPPPGFTFEVSPSVVPTVSALPSADGGTSPVGAFEDSKGVSTDFVTNEVVIAPDSSAELDQFLDDYGGTIIDDDAVPEPPAFLSTKTRMQAEDSVPTNFTVRVTIFPDTDSFAEDAAEIGLKGAYLFSSNAAVGLIALVSHELRHGLKVQPNFVLVGHAMMHATEEHPTPTGFKNAMEYRAFLGLDAVGSSRSSIAKAWQFVEAAGYVDWGWGGMTIIDGGFWLNSAGGPFTSPAGLGTDMPPTIAQYDFYEKDFYAGGENPAKCTGGSPCPWHGNNSASVAAGFVNNQSAIAGSGGQVSRPYLFRVKATHSQLEKAVRTARSWGAETISMSMGFDCNDACELYLTYLTNFYERFAEAFDAGIILVASAGNDGVDVNSNNVLPCGVPGVICVGALGDYQNVSASYSNYGNGVDIWADTNIPAMPNGASPNDLTNAGGTSASAPLVAGVAMMMKRILPSLNSDTTLGLLQETAYKLTPDPKVAPVGFMDAYRAVRAAAGDQIFEDIFEPNDSASNATPLTPGHYEDLTLNPSNKDYFLFTAGDYSAIDFNLEYMVPMGGIAMTLIPDTEDAILTGVSRGNHGRGYHYAAALIPPGSYNLMLNSLHPQYYFVDYAKNEVGLSPDQFEDNNTLLSANGLFQTTGAWDLTLHQNDNSDADYYKISIPCWVDNVLGRQYKIVDLDGTLRVELIDPTTEVVINSHAGEEAKFMFTSDSACRNYILKVYNSYTRYVLDVRSKLTFNLWEETVPYEPFVWEDPLGPVTQQILREPEDWLVLTGPERDIQDIELLAEGLSMKLYNADVELLGSGVPIYGRAPFGAEDLKVGELLDASGLVGGETYLLQVYRSPEAFTQEPDISAVQENVPYTLQVRLK